MYPNNPGLPLAARVLDTYAALGLGHISDTVLDRYAQAADLVAAADLAADLRALAEVAASAGDNLLILPAGALAEVARARA